MKKISFYNPYTERATIITVVQKGDGTDRILVLTKRVRDLEEAQEWAEMRIPRRCNWETENLLDVLYENAMSDKGFFSEDNYTLSIVGNLKKGKIAAVYLEGDMLKRLKGNSLSIKDKNQPVVKLPTMEVLDCDFGKGVKGKIMVNTQLLLNNGLIILN